MNACRSRACIWIALALLLPWERARSADHRENWERMRKIEPERYIAPWTAQPINIDGRLDDPAWKAAPWTAHFRDIEGDAKPRPRFATRARMTWDDVYFYVGAELEEPHVWGTLTNHDAVIFHDPDFEVFIDPDGDSHDYYEFEINALNTGWDLLLKKPYKDGGPALNSWEIPGLKTAIHIQGTLNDPRDKDAGWTLEIALPWKALGEFTRRAVPPAESDQWRVNFSRVEWLIEIVEDRYRKVPGKKEDNWVWSPQGIVDMHRPEKWGYVQFTRARPGTVTFRPDPTASARAVLHDIYYSQKDFQKTHKRWATSLTELDWKPSKNIKDLSEPALKTTPDGFQATVALQQEGAPLERWHIRQDAKIWSGSNGQ